MALQNQTLLRSPELNLNPHSQCVALKIEFAFILAPEFLPTLVVRGHLKSKSVPRVLSVKPSGLIPVLITAGDIYTFCINNFGVCLIWYDVNVHNNLLQASHVSRHRTLLNRLSVPLVSMPIRRAPGVFSQVQSDRPSIQAGTKCRIRKNFNGINWGFVYCVHHIIHIIQKVFYIAPVFFPPSSHIHHRFHLRNFTSAAPTSAPLL